MVSSQHERQLHERYEWLHILNDLLISIAFLIGSIFFLYDSLKHMGVWLFIIGSVLLLMGPIIRTANKLHVRNIRKEVIHW